MALTLSVHPFGPRALDALGRAVGSLKGTQVLAPVTVVVDRGAVGLAARRRLAAVPGGVANVRFLPWSRMAAELAVAWVSSPDRRARTAAMELEALRAVLDSGQGRPAHGSLARAAEQPATVRALVRTCRELAGLPDPVLEALGGQSARSAEVVAVVRSLRDRLRGTFDRTDLLAAAADAVRAGTADLEATGPVVAYLPERLGPAECNLMEALASRTAVAVIVGSTGDETADGPVRTVASRVGIGVGSAGPDGPEGAFAAAPREPKVTVRSAPSADAEVLMALRFLARRNAEGVPLERMALLHGGTAPYPVLAQDEIAISGLPAHGPGARSLAATMAGRVLLGGLALADRDWRRDEVMAWIAAGPLLHGGSLVPSAEWDRVSCDAGIVSGVTEWRDRLRAHGLALRTRAELLAEAAPGTDSAPRLADGCRQDADHCEQLWRFLASVTLRLEETPRRWADWWSWAEQLLSDLLGGPARRGKWPDDEVAAFDAVSAALSSLGALDSVSGPAPRMPDFRSALAAELDRPAPRTARFGQGLLVGPVGAAVGIDLDVVCVVGMVDGTFPPRTADDILIPDRERAAVGPDVPLRGAAQVEGRRAFFAAVAGAGEIVLSYPRGDQRTGRELRPARLVLDALERSVPGSSRLHPGDVRWGPPTGSGIGVFQYVRSFAEAVADEDGAGEPVSEEDWRVRSLTRWRRRHERTGARDTLAGHAMAQGDPVLSGALACRRARRSAALTRFDGKVDAGDVPAPAGAVPQSPTRIESYLRCPRSYFFDAVLGLVVRPSPETVLLLSPVERGVLVHRVLERLVADERPGMVRDVGQTEQRMLTLAESAFSDLERRGTSGHPALWAVERSRILGDLRQFVRDDAAYRAATGAVPVAVEERFGDGHDSGVEVDVGGGRVVRFRGRVDRVDALPGGPLAVIDYKTGKPFKIATPEDPLSGGTHVQLPVYALAARRRHGSDRAVVSGYWFVGSSVAPSGLFVDGPVIERLGEAVGTAVDGIDGGRFPANPGGIDPSGDGHAVNCRTCPFDRVCPPDRSVTWVRKRTDPSLERYRRLVEPA